MARTVTMRGKLFITRGTNKGKKLNKDKQKTHPDTNAPVRSRVNGNIRFKSSSLIGIFG